MARLANAVASTASASTPGARKSTASPLMGNTSTRLKNTRIATGIPNVSNSDSPLRKVNVSSNRSCAASAFTTPPRRPIART
jgi:hypothetical protein